MKKLDYDEIKHAVKYCSASGGELRAQLWPVKEARVKEEKEKTPLFGHFIWRALAYIFVALFAGAIAVGSGIATTDQIENIYSFVGDRLDDALS